MHKLHELKEKLIKELEGYAENGKYSKEDVEAIKYMASAVDHLCNIVEDMDDEEYSGRMYYDDGMGMGGRSMRSYRRDGSYARGRGRNAKRDAMGRYASADGYSRGDVIAQLEDIMAQAPDDRTRREMQTFITKMEGMM